MENSKEESEFTLEPRKAPKNTELPVFHLIFKLDLQAAPVALLAGL